MNNVRNILETTEEVGISFSKGTTEPPPPELWGISNSNRIAT